MTTAAEYGKAPAWALDERDYASMKQYYEQLPLCEPAVDDITWNDLNMDAIFKRIKNTQSSIGDEYSYRFLTAISQPQQRFFLFAKIH